METVDQSSIYNNLKNIIQNAEFEFRDKVLRFIFIANYIYLLGRSRIKISIRRTNKRN